MRGHTSRATAAPSPDPFAGKARSETVSLPRVTARLYSRAAQNSGRAADGRGRDRRCPRAVDVEAASGRLGGAARANRRGRRGLAGRRGRHARSRRRRRSAKRVLSRPRQRCVKGSAVLPRRRLLLGLDRQPPAHGHRGRPRLRRPHARGRLSACAGAPVSRRPRRCGRRLAISARRPASRPVISLSEATARAPA